MQVIFRYLAYAFVSLIALSAVAITRYPHAEFAEHTAIALVIGTAAVVLLTAVSLWREDDLTDQAKGLLVRGFLIAVLAPTVFATGAYIHEVETSWSNGEIHWHADFEVFVDGERRDLIAPSNYCKQYSEESTYMCTLNDRVGITPYHEHNDMRIHLEGTFKERERATLAAFFDAFQGTLTNDELRYPTNDGWINRTADDENTVKVLIQQGVGGDRGWCAIAKNVDPEDRCVDANNGQPAQSPEDYVISPYQRGPVLDVIYVVYDDTPVGEALEDVREDDEYRGMGILKSGEEY